MPVIAIECPTCLARDEVVANAVFVEVDAAQPDDASQPEGESPAATVCWICGRCQDLVALPVGWSALLAVVSAGAALVDAQPDDRPEHPESPADGPALTPDDLLDFHEGLGGTTWGEELAAPSVQREA
jgi:hypothetical protein